MVNLAAPRGLWAAGLSLLVGRIAGGGHAVGLAPKSREGEMVMMVYIDDDEPMFVEQLGLDDAKAVLSRTRASLPWAFNSAHAVALRAEIAAVEDQIDWLETQECESVTRERAAEMAYDLWVDHDLGVPA